MAVTISESPDNYSPSDNPLRFTFSSTQTAQANFSYIVKTYFNGNLESEDRVFPENGIYAHFDCSPIVKNLFSQPTIGTAIWQESGIRASIYVTVIENYGTTPTNHASATSSTINIFKGCLSDHDWIYFDSADYNVGTAPSAKFMTPFADVPSSMKLYRQRDVPYVLQAIQNNASKNLAVKLYNSGGLIAGFSDTDNFYIPQIVIDDSILLTSCGFSAGDIAASEWVEINLGNAVFYVYSYDESCPGEPSTLQWVNQFGSFDSFVFAHNIVRAGEVTERTYMKKFGKWGGNAFGYSLPDSGMMRVGTQQTDKLTIYTDWITDDQQHALTTLYKAPKHRLYIDGVEYNVKLNSNQFTFSQQRFEEEVTEAVELQIATNHNGLSL